MKKLLAISLLCCWCYVYAQESPSQYSGSDPVNVPMVKNSRALKKRSASRGSSEALKLGKQHGFPPVNNTSNTLSRIDGIPAPTSPRSMPTSPRPLTPTSRWSRSEQTRVRSNSASAGSQ